MSGSPPSFNPNAANRECRFYHASLATELALTEAIQTGLPNGNTIGAAIGSSWLHTSDHQGYDGNNFLVRIPPGVAHGCKSLRTADPSAIIYFVDVQFSVGDDCDEGRLPWDHFGSEVWDVERG